MRFYWIILWGMMGLACQPRAATEVSAPAETTAATSTDSAPPALTREVIATPDAPPAIGPYSQAIKVGHTIYCAGQVGLDPETRELVAGGIVAETHRTLQNIRAVLQAGGFSMDDIVQAQVFLADLDDYTAMNEVYASYFSIAPPARLAVQAARLPRSARIEIIATAVKAE